MPPRNNLTQTKRAAFRKKIKAQPGLPKILVEGDSWFAFPLPQRRNVIDHLIDIGRAAWLREDRSGDEVLEMLCGKQRKKMRRLLKTYEFDALLFSGGGNDIVGHDLYGMLKDKKPGASWRQCVNDERLERRLTQIEHAYLDLIDLRDDHCDPCVILTHGYDYPHPQNKGIRLWGKTLIKPWMWPAMTERGITGAGDQRELARHLIQQFNLRLQSVATKASQSKPGKFIVIDTPRTLKQDEWGDEIHPTNDGFRKVARTFLPELNRLFPTYFPKRDPGQSGVTPKPRAGGKGAERLRAGRR